MKPVSVNTLKKYLELLGTNVETKLKKKMPASFGIIIDGWSCACEHYFAIFATWSTSSGEVERYLICCGVQDDDDTGDVDDDAGDNSLNFRAEAMGDYIYYEIQLLGKTFDDIEFICADNTNTNPKLARLISKKCKSICPLIGCNSHKLNLAVQAFLLPYEQLIDKV